MTYTAILLFVSAVASTCNALPTASSASLPQILSVQGAKLQNSYIVKFKDGANQTETLNWFRSKYGADKIDFQYPPSVSIASVERCTISAESRHFQVLNGFSGQFDETTAHDLMTQDGIESVAEDPIWTAVPVQ